MTSPTTTDLLRQVAEKLDWGYQSHFEYDFIHGKGWQRPLTTTGLDLVIIAELLVSECERRMYQVVSVCGLVSCDALIAPVGDDDPGVEYEEGNTESRNEAKIRACCAVLLGGE